MSACRMTQPRIDRPRSQSTARVRASEAPGPARPGKRSRVAAMPRIIATDDDVREGVRALRRKCAIMRHVHDTAGHPPLRRRRRGSRASPASSSASRSRLPARPRSGRARPRPAARSSRGVPARSHRQQFAAAGLSRPKIRTLRAIADGLHQRSRPGRPGWRQREQVHAALDRSRRHRPWTADVYIMFCLGRADGWAPGDLALQIAAQKAMGLDERPGAMRSRRSPSAGGPGAASRRDCYGPITPCSKQQGSAVPV